MTPEPRLPPQASLQRRLALVAGGAALALSILFLAVVTLAYRDRLLDGHARASLQVNRLLQSALENAMLKRDVPGLERIVRELGGQDGIDGVQIVNPAGEVRFSSYGSGIGAPLAEPAVAEALTSGAPVSVLRDVPLGGTVLRTVNPVHNRAQCHECHGAIEDSPINGVLVVDVAASGLRAEILRGSLALGGMGALVVLAMLAALWVALRRMVLRPLEALSGAATALAEGDLSRRVALPGEDELARTGRAFDQMAARLSDNLDALDRQRELLQGLIDGIPDGVRVIGPDFRILMANAAYGRQLGHDGPATAMPCHLSSHARATPCVPTLTHCPVAELLEAGAAPGRLKCSQTHVTATGSPLPVEVQAARLVLDVDGTPTPVVIESIRDLDAQIEISQEQRLAEMGMLAAGVAHEVFNPLSSIQLILDALRAEPALSAQGREYLGLAQTEIASCQKVTDSLLRLAAPPGERGAMPPLTEVGPAMADTAQLLAHEADARDVARVTDCAPGIMVRAADADLRMLLFNLAQNAVHAMPDGGTLTLSCAEAEDKVILSVSDTGLGIDPHDAARVMLPFWTRRADGSTGRGLGLSICTAITRGLGGSIDFDSAPGQGTTFRVTLPAAPLTSEATA